MNPNIGLKQFRQEGCLSYLVFDPKTRAAAVIDPKVEAMEDYRSFIADERLKPVFALDTHTHADHRSASHLFKGEFHAEVAMGGATSSERPSRKLQDGEKLPLGGLTIEVLSTPGHTPDSVCFLAGGKLLFTGDTLLIGSSGRTDFPGSDPAEQWESLHHRLGALPPTTVVLPGHDYNELLFSTLAIEKSKNAHLLIPSKTAFVEFKKAEVIGGLSSDVKANIDFNCKPSPETPPGPTGKAMACGAALDLGERFATINVEKYQQKLKSPVEGMVALDVRERDEFAEGHIPGTRNIPLSEVALHFEELASASRIYASCLGGVRSARVAKTLSYLGLPDVVNVSGGYNAWVHAGLPTTAPEK